MIIGRRKFLHLMGASSAAAVLSPTSAIAIENNLYVNKRLGFSIEKPRSWHFMSIIDFELHAEEMEKNSSDPELQKELHGFVGKPILSMSKYPYHSDTPEGIANIQIYADPITSQSEADFLEEIDNGKYRLSRYYSNYQIVEDTRNGRVAGNAYSTYTATFNAELNGKEYQVRTKSYAVYTGTVELYFIFQGLTGNLDGSEEEINFAIQSLNFLNG